MKRYILSAVTLILSCIFLAACGAEKKGEESVWQGIAPELKDLSDITERTEYYDVTIESENFSLNREGMPVGAHFFQGEPIQICAEGTSVYLYKKDGSKEHLLSNVSSQYTVSSVPMVEFESGQYTQYSYHWYIDQEGDFYCYGTIYEHSGQYDKREGSLVKILSSGEIYYEISMGKDVLIEDLCQMEDGNVYLLLCDRTEDDLYGNWFLAEMDPDTGKLIQKSVNKLPFKFNVYLGKTGRYPSIVGCSSTIDDRQISKVDMDEGSLSPILFFTGTSYGWHNAEEIIETINVRVQLFLDEIN